MLMFVCHNAYTDRQMNLPVQVQTVILSVSSSVRCFPPDRTQLYMGMKHSTFAGMETMTFIMTLRRIHKYR